MFTPILDRHVDRRLRRLAIEAMALAGALVIFAAPVDAKPQPFRSPSKSIETSSDMVSLPSPGGTVVIARGCDTCDPVSLSLAAGTEFRIGNRNVSYAEFRDRARSGSYSMTVHYHRKTLEVLRFNLDSND